MMPCSWAWWSASAIFAQSSADSERVLTAELERLGFDPESADEGDDVSIAFLHCPFRDLAEAYPELVCNLHRGICEGVVETVGGGSVTEFATLYDHDPCRVTVAVGYPEES